MRRPLSVEAGFVAVVAAAMGAPAYGSVQTAGLSEFSTADIERFDGPFINAQIVALASGMTYRNLSTGVADNVNVRADIGCPGRECLTYGLGTVPEVVWGAEGRGDGYFGTSGSVTTGGSLPSFEFSTPIDRFAFLGAEAIVGSDQSDGRFDLVFFDPADRVVGRVEITTVVADPWTQFHGFRFGTPVNRVEFVGTGALVLDNLRFSTAAIPTPSVPLLMAPAVALLWLCSGRRRRLL